MERGSIDGGVGANTEINRRRIEMETAVRFRFFFTGLVFAILSFAIQFPVSSNVFAIKITEVSSWALFAVTGILALFDSGVVRGYTQGGLTRKWSIFMWICFFGGVLLLLASKAWQAFHG